MGSMDRSKKRIQLWKKALVHFALCFVMGFFTGFAPHSTATLFSHRRADRQPVTGISFHPAAPVEQVVEPDGEAVNRSLIEIPRSAAVTAVAPGDDSDDPPPSVEGSVEAQPPSRRLLIIVTTTRADDRFQGALLLRLAHTLRLVPPPLLWIVVQAYAEAPATAAMLRTTGVIYRHLTFKENFTDPAAEADHQRNVALSHVEYHRLTGIVHFAGASNAYDLRFFEEIREIEAFGTWPVAMVSTNRKRVVVDGPVCRASRVEGWILKDSSNDKRLLPTGTDMNPKPPKINISGFAFNSSILWDPERWGRPTSLPDTSQDSIKFVHEVILEDETKLKCLPADCSRIMVWHLYTPRAIPLPFHDQSQAKRYVTLSEMPSWCPHLVLVLLFTRPLDKKDMKGSWHHRDRWKNAVWCSVERTLTALFSTRLHRPKSHLKFPTAFPLTAPRPHRQHRASVERRLVTGHIPRSQRSTVSATHRILEGSHLLLPRWAPLSQARD